MGIEAQGRVRQAISIFVRGCAEAHGGALAVTSSTFTLRLPRDARPHQAA